MIAFSAPLRVLEHTLSFCLSLCVVCVARVFHHDFCCPFNLYYSTDCLLYGKNDRLSFFIPFSVVCSPLICLFVWCGPSRMTRLQSLGVVLLFYHF